MNNLLTAIEQRVLVIDGAMGTEMMKLGLGVGECGEIWNIEQPDKILRIQQGYVDAGADIIITNTFSANRIALQKHGLTDKAGELIQAGVELAKKAAGDSRIVLGDIGPTGELMEPLGVHKYEDFKKVFLEQAAALNEAGADGFIIETMTDLQELKASIEACAEFGKPVVASMSFNTDADGSGFHTMMGVSPTDMAEGLKNTAATVIGANCGTVDAMDMVRIVEEIQATNPMPVIVEANAGKPRNVAGRTFYDGTPRDMAAAVPALVAAGARLIGGCCGTTATHIRAIREKLDET